MSEQSFSRTLANHFVESLRAALSALGEGAANSFYYHIRQKYAMVPADLPRRARDFDKALSELFGKGSSNIVRTCAEKLMGRMGGRIPREPRSLSELWLEATQTRTR